MHNLIHKLILIFSLVVSPVLLYAVVAVSGSAPQTGPAEAASPLYAGTRREFAPLPAGNHPGSDARSSRGEGPEEAVSGELLVKLRPTARRAELTGLHGRLGAAVVDEVTRLGVLVIRVPEGRRAAAETAYRSDSRVEYVEPNYIAHAEDTLNASDYSAHPYDSPNDPYLPQQYAIPIMKLPAAWDRTHGSPQVIIAIVDTGVEFGHPDLRGKIAQGYDFVNDSSLPNDDHGHGTHVAGIPGARTNNGIGIAGVCWECKIMPVKVLSAGGSGTHARIAQGIIWATDHGARVINLSLGGSYGSQTLHDAIKYAWNNGVVLVAAAGSDSSRVPAYPAGYPEVIAVTATDANDHHANFASYGPHISVAAPGVAILSTTRDGGYQAWSGTSLATAEVAGLAGLIISQNPSLSNTLVRRIMEVSADDLGAPGRDDYFGYGRVNAERALIAFPDPTGIPPVPTLTPAPTPAAAGGVYFLPVILQKAP